MADRDAPFLKWFPVKAQLSKRWKRQKVIDRGIFHELYDEAATSAVRGRLYTFGEGNVPRPLTVKEMAVGIGARKGQVRRALRRLRKSGLMGVDEAGAYVFPAFQRHQEKAPYRIRHVAGAAAGRAKVETDEDQIVSLLLGPNPTDRQTDAISGPLATAKRFANETWILNHLALFASDKPPWDRIKAAGNAARDALSRESQRLTRMRGDDIVLRSMDELVSRAKELQVDHDLYRKATEWGGGKS